VWLVLAHAADASARWAFERLAAWAPTRVALVTVEALEHPATRWVHRVDDAGAGVDVQLADGRRLRTGEIAAVLNRMTWPPLRALAGAAPGDAEYARAELTAFAVSWLASLAPVVVNPPTPQGLCGRWRPALEWRALGARAGLPVVPLRLDGALEAPTEPATGRSTALLAVDGELLAPGVPPAVRDAVRRFAALAQTPVLGLRFLGPEPGRHGWRLLDATPQPDLSAAGEAGVTALAARLAA
jgi:hypothetical protein